jgi:hypothetical protein
MKFQAIDQIAELEGVLDTESKVGAGFRVELATDCDYSLMYPTNSKSTC